MQNTFGDRTAVPANGNGNKTGANHRCVERRPTRRAGRMWLAMAAAVCVAIGGCDGEPKAGDAAPHGAGAHRNDEAHGGKGEAGHGEPGHDEEGHDEAGHDEPGHEAEGDRHEGDANIVEMEPAMMKQADVAVARVARGPVAATMTAPGRVVPTGAGVAHVGTMLGGRVVRLYVDEGARVRRGAVLAEIEALDIGQLKGDYLHARAQVAVTAANLARQENLTGDGTGARKLFEEARSANAQALATMRASETKLRAAGIAPEGLNAGKAFSSRVALRAPIAGIVTRRSVVLGEHIEANEDAFEVMNTATVWVDAEVPPQKSVELNVGDVAFIDDAQGHRRSGRVIYISPTADPSSRKVTARVEIENHENHFRPETFVTVEFERTARQMALAIPVDAIEREGSSFFVYREQRAGRFERVAVDVGEQHGGRAIIRAGLTEGDRIAVSGVFYLKSARQKSELAEHHH